MLTLKRLISLVLIFCLFSVNGICVCPKASAATKNFNSIERERILFLTNHPGEDIAAKSEAEHRAKIKSMIEEYQREDIHYTETQLEKDAAMLSDGFDIAAGICEAIPGGGTIASAALKTLSIGCGELKKSEADKTQEMLQQMMERIDYRFDIIDEKLSLMDEQISSIIPELKEYFNDVNIQDYYATKFNKFREDFKDYGEEGVRFKTYSEWKRALRDEYNALLECYKKNESAKYLQEHYELLYLHATEVNTLYSYIFEDYNDSFDYSIAKIYYDFLVMSDYIGKSVNMTSEDITWETVSYINDLYHTYILAKYSHIISLLYRAQIMDGTVESNGISYERYRDISQTALNKAINGFASEINTVKKELTEDLAYVLGLDLSYTYAADVDNADSYINVPYYSIYDVNSETETMVTNNEVTKGATILMNKLPHIPDSIYDYSEFSFRITNGSDLAVIDNNGKISVTGTAGMFTAAMFYDDKLIYSLDFQIKSNPFSGGMGTAEFPYIISTNDDLKNIYNDIDLTNVKDYTNKHFVLVNDIDLSKNTRVYPESGNANYHYNFKPVPEFSGKFDGRGHTISGMEYYRHVEGDIVSTEEAFLGLFEVNSGTIRNLELSEFNLYRHHYERAQKRYGYIGAVCGRNKETGIIENITVKDSMINYYLGYNDHNKTMVYAGGICGQNVGTVSKCGATNIQVCARVKTCYDNAYAFSGGVAGQTLGLTNDCFANNCTIVSHSNCGSDKNFFGKWTSGKAHVRVGGIVGAIDPNGQLSRCIAGVNTLDYSLGGFPSSEYCSYYIGEIYGECNVSNEKINNTHEITSFAATDISKFDSFTENGWRQKENGEPYFEKSVSEAPSSYQIYLPEEISATGISLESLPLYEYSISECGGAVEAWQQNANFTNLIPGTPYKIYVRTAETDLAAASVAASPIMVFTKKHKASTPTDPVVLSKNSTKIALKYIDGYEYSLDGVIWQNSNEFDKLIENTEYTFYQRIAETDTTYSSESSKGIIIKTDKEIKATVVNVEKDTTNNACVVNYEITADDLVKSPVLYIAFYNDKNGFMEVIVKDEDILAFDEITIDIPENSAQCRVMLWGDSLSPLCDAAYCKIN